MWSTVMRIPTSRGNVWFKANWDAQRHEAALESMLSARMPDLVAPPLAVDLSSGWMLMPDFGRRLREEGSLSTWMDVIPRYAELQIEFSDRVDELLAAGVPDMRMDTLPEKFENLVTRVDVDERFRDAVPYVRSLCDRLATYEIAETIQHDDLHDGQVFVADGVARVMDWGDACVSHPFFTLSVTLEGWIADSDDIRPYRDAYLTPFEARYGRDLKEAAGVAMRLGWACRAVNGYLPGDDDQTVSRLRMLVDGHV